jgi:hypothetical protein
MLFPSSFNHTVSHAKVIQRRIRNGENYSKRFIRKSLKESSYGLSNGPLHDLPTGTVETTKKFCQDNQSLDQEFNSKSNANILPMSQTYTATGFGEQYQYQHWSSTSF